MKYDIKGILVIILLITTLIFGYKWYFGGNSSDEKIKELNEQYTKLEAEKKEKDLEIAKYRKDFIEKDNSDKEMQKEIIKAKDETMKAIIKASESKAELDKLKIDLIITRNKIDKFEKNPPNREGDSLLISIKNHTK